LTLKTPEKAAMGPRQGKKRDRLSDHANQPGASPTPKDLNFFSAEDNTTMISLNGKYPIGTEDSLPKAKAMLTIFEDNPNQPTCAFS
jgi:hypothetical protein